MIGSAVYWFLPSLLIGFLSVFLVAKINRKKGIIGIDINKPSQIKLPESVGIAMLVPLWIVSAAGLLNGVFGILETKVAIWLFMVSVFSSVGLLDDIKPKFLGKTRSWGFRALTIAVVSLVFAALNFPYSLLAIVAALYLAGIASFENTFAGLNGWEIGSGFIISVFYFILLFVSGSPLYPLALIVSGAILAMLLFNLYPARAFPGDSGTLLIGSALAGMMVIAGSWTLMVFSFLFFLPHMIDFAVKMATNPSDPSQRKARPYSLDAEGKINLPDYKGKKKLDFAKLLIIILGPKKEHVLVAIIWILVAVNCSFWSFLFLSL